MPKSQVKRTYCIVALSLLVGFMLTILPAPEWARWLRPNWLALLLIYWAMCCPHQVSIGIAWFIGLFVDVLQNTLLGEHALSLTLITYIVVKLHIRLQLFPMSRQMLSILLLLETNQFILFWLQGSIQGLPLSGVYWLNPVISMLLWPWVYHLMNAITERFKVGLFAEAHTVR